MLEPLDEMPRARFCHGPTPLEPMDNLARRIGCRQAWVKRDDCTGMAFGGNKVRQLEFYLGDARAKGADTILITGAIQSNFVRSAAAAAAKLGMICHVQLEERTPKSDATYRTSGNVLLDKMLGAQIHYFPKCEDEAGADRALEELAAGIKQDGGRPYVIHLSPGHPPIGALGYVACARELLQQLDEQSVRIDEFIVPSGSGATHAGFLFGLRALGCGLPVVGMCVRRGAGEQRPRLWERCGEIAALLGVINPVLERDIVLDDTHLAPGYGLMNPATSEAIRLAARTEALMLDPVYTGKCFAGFIARARREPDQSLCVLHTGGTPAIFAYAEDIAEAVGGA